MIKNNALLRLRAFCKIITKGSVDVCGCLVFNYEWSFDDEDRIDDETIMIYILISKIMEIKVSY